ncbi:unnamed protein product [Amoebophrya sp. A120]|nr:unnamed protein product [Amoebophrya sp. A120]|eukprot:GSA120T00018011001.1
MAAEWEWDLFRLADALRVEVGKPESEGEGLSQMTSYAVTVFLLRSNASRNSLETSATAKRVLGIDENQFHGQVAINPRAHQVEDAWSMKLLSGSAYYTTSATATAGDHGGASDNAQKIAEVRRFYHDLVWLWEQLQKRFPFWIMPALPGKSIVSTFTDEEKLLARAQWYADALNQLASEHFFSDLRTERFVFEWLCLPKFATVQRNFPRLAAVPTSITTAGGTLHAHSSNPNLAPEDAEIKAGRASAPSPAELPTAARPPAFSVNSTTGSTLQTLLRKAHSESRAFGLGLKLSQVARSVSAYVGTNFLPTNRAAARRSSTSTTSSSTMTAAVSSSSGGPFLAGVDRDDRGRGSSTTSSPAKATESQQAVGARATVSPVPNSNDQEENNSSCDRNDHSKTTTPAGTPASGDGALCDSDHVVCNSDPVVDQLEDDHYGDQLTNSRKAEVWLQRVRARFALEARWLTDTKQRLERALHHLRAGVARLLEWRDAQTEVGLLLDSLPMSLGTVHAGNRYLQEVERLVLYPLERLLRSLLNAQDTLRRRNAIVSQILEATEVLSAKSAKLKKKKALAAASSTRKNTTGGAASTSSVSASSSSSSAAGDTLLTPPTIMDECGAEFKEEEDELRLWVSAIEEESQMLTTLDDLLEAEMTRFQAWAQQTMQPCVKNWETTLRTFGQGLDAATVSAPAKLPMGVVSTS